MTSEQKKPREDDAPDRKAAKVEYPQPWPIWILVYKDNGKRKVAFSFDGPPSDKYQKLIGVNAYQQLEERAEHFETLSRRQLTELAEAKAEIERLNWQGAVYWKAQYEQVKNENKWLKSKVGESRIYALSRINDRDRWKEQAEKLAEVLSMECPKYIAHPQAVWFEEHRGKALAEFEKFKKGESNV